MRHRRAVVLLSGGLDSATTLAQAIDSNFECYALTIRYGQRHALEVGRARSIASAAGVADHRVIDLDLSFLTGSALVDPETEIPTQRDPAEIGGEIPATYVPARNTVFLSLALAWAESLGAVAVFLGVNAVDYSGYPDCRPEFLQQFQRLIRLATRVGVEGQAIEVRAPLLRLTKGEIVVRAQELGVDLALTLSCYRPSKEGIPCGVCDSCLLRERGFAEAGQIDPARVESRDGADGD